jgi:hypothetical protein
MRAVFLKSHLGWRQTAAFFILKIEREIASYEERVAFCPGCGH